MSQASTPHAGSRVLRTFQAAILFVSAIVGGSLGISIWAGLAPALGVAEGSTAFQVLQTVAQFVGFVAPVALFVASSGDRSLLALGRPSRREAAITAVGVVGLFLLQYGLLAALSTVGVTPVENQAIASEGHAPAYFLWMVVVSILVVGPAEELLFRGAVQGLLKRAWGPWPAIVAAAALFGSLHYSVGTGTQLQALTYVGVALLLGVVLGWLAERTGTLLVPMLVHGGYNAVAFGLQYFDAVS